MSGGPAPAGARPGLPAPAAPDAMSTRRAASEPWTLAREGRAVWLGRVRYDDALALQHDLHADRVAGRAPDTLLLLEHDSVYTSGRATDPAHFLVPRETLEREGHDVRETHRGGDVTWHGPGQLVAYPILFLGDGRRDVHRYLRALEEVLVRISTRLGAPAWRVDGRTGAWTSGGKIGAIGIRVARWVTQHGTALNVAPDLARFGAVVPCGLHGAAVTSIERETGEAPGVEACARIYAEAFSDVTCTTFPHGLEVQP